MRWPRRAGLILLFGAILSKELALFLRWRGQLLFKVTCMFHLVFEQQQPVIEAVTASKNVHPRRKLPDQTLLFYICLVSVHVSPCICLNGVLHKLPPFFVTFWGFATAFITRCWCCLNTRWNIHVTLNKGSLSPSALGENSSKKQSWLMLLDIARIWHAWVHVGWCPEQAPVCIFCYESFIVQDSAPRTVMGQKSL